MHSPALDLQRPNITALMKLLVLAQLGIRYKKILTDIRRISVNILLMRGFMQASQALADFWWNLRYATKYDVTVVGSAHADFSIS